MKKYVFLLFVLLMSIHASSQKAKDSTYLDAQGLIWKGKTSNGKMTGRWSSFDKKNRLARSVIFYDNGLKVGVHTYYQANGKLASVLNYKEGKLEGTTIHFTPERADTLGIVNYTNGQPHGSWILNNWRGQLMHKIEWVNGVADTNSLFNKFFTITAPPEDYMGYIDLARKYIGTYYENNQFKNLANRRDNDSIIHLNKISTPPKIVERPVHFVGVMPNFPGGEKELMNFLKQKSQYPSPAKEKKVMGMVIISFTVNADGSISNEKVSKSVPGAPELSGEALRVISLMPNWEVQITNGNYTPVTMNLPIRFTLL